MEELKALKIEYKNIINDINNHPDHIKNYDLEAMYKELYNKEVRYLTGCSDVKALEYIPVKYLHQIHTFIKSILQYCVDQQVVLR